MNDGEARRSTLVRGTQAPRAGEVTTNQAPLNAIRKGIPRVRRILLREEINLTCGKSANRKK